MHAAPVNDTRVERHRQMLNTDVLVILGCGALGTAILLGLLSGSPTSYAPHGTNRNNSNPNVPSRFIACVRRNESANAVKRGLKNAGFDSSNAVDIRVCDNVNAVQEANVILLAIQPHLIRNLLDEPGMRKALAEKLIISVLAGVTVHDIEAALKSGTDHNDIVRVMPNINCFAKQSTTVIERGSASQQSMELVGSLFKCVGEVFFTDPSTMDACTALCGSTPAFFTVVLEGLVEGAIATGIKSDDALKMAAHAMMGTASLILQDRQPAAVRHEVTSPGGSTIQGVLALEENRVRWAFTKALQVATTATSKLGSREDLNVTSE
ncbi:Pyrroline-5-carboxylate reductase [Pseudocercospora fuligena]|uniref:Pyrroline-5-carboxylate reductase n=1 Tax=Pseudocercospora fuligena TaxID=685502 RepID=A0A8H6R647_9PEZI|nr:Pyrroline-5-carboxylate reductase [Pseudocercospora fuligena]